MRRQGEKDIGNLLVYDQTEFDVPKYDYVFSKARLIAAKLRTAWNKKPNAEKKM